ncbi:MAG: GmrSD restriction endonuclease domain-containing protein [Candidatus Methylomirabilales bacterium]
MKHFSRPQIISWFQEHYKAGRLQLRPPFQRKPVWTKQRSFLIESILMDIPIPEVYVHVTPTEDGTEHYGVVDGQQRLRTILQFIGIERDGDQGEVNNNLFGLEALPEGSIHKDKTFADVTPEERKRFFQYEICVRFLYTDDLKVVEDVFKRLNKFTLPLKPQELRNATFHGAFAKLSERLADDEYWAVNRIVSPAAIRRMADIEMMSELLIGLLHGPQGGSAKIIDEYYEQFERYEDEFPEQGRVKRQFAKTLTTIQRLFPVISDVPRWGNRADYYSLFVALGNLLKDDSLSRKSENALATKLIEFAKEVNLRLVKPTAKTSSASKKYARAIEKGVNDKARRIDRHEALIEIITPYLRKKIR